jgi:2-polyprenyl-6-methoxyphenol hydroxylase-like FAD-dependent oxidoreductase
LLTALSRSKHNLEDTRSANLDKSVLIVGAGPVGLAMALSLSENGVSFRIIDQTEAPTTQSRALAIHARTLEIFEQLGIVEPLLKAGQKISVMNVYAHKRQLTHITLDELDSPFPFILGLPQSETERILVSVLQSRGIEVERKTQLVNVIQDKNGVKATLKYPDGSGMEEKFGWLLACDGAHSTVRHLLNLTFAGSQYPESFFLADVRLDTELAQNEAHIFIDNSGMLAIFPYGGYRFRVVADVPVEATMSDSADTASVYGGSQEAADKRARLSDPTLPQMQAFLDERGPGGIQMSEATWLAAFTIQRRKVSRYRIERIFLAGDAAHIHSPAGGQGMNTGIQDACNLAWKLALVINQEAPVALLDSYEMERHAVAESVLKMTDFITRVNTTRNPLAVSLRTKLAPIVIGQEVIQQRITKTVSELGVNYRKSPIVGEYHVGLVHAKVPGHAREELPEFSEWFNFESGPRPGDRAPDANLLDEASTSPVRLFELLRGQKHHLLLFAGARSTASGVKTLIENANFVLDKYGRWLKVHFISPQADEFKGASGAASTWSDSELSAHHRYGAASECLYLIRPDGYVGYRSQPADQPQLSRYLSKIFLA